MERWPLTPVPMNHRQKGQLAEVPRAGDLRHPTVQPVDDDPSPQASGEPARMQLAMAKGAEGRYDVYLKRQFRLVGGRGVLTIEAISKTMWRALFKGGKGRAADARAISPASFRIAEFLSRQAAFRSTDADQLAEHRQSLSRESEITPLSNHSSLHAYSNGRVAHSRSDF